MYANKENNVSDILQNEHDAHLKQKELASVEKQRDKQTSNSDELVYVAMFDLQSVL